MMSVIKVVFRALGLKRDRATRWRFRLQAWCFKPHLFFCWANNRRRGRNLLCFPYVPDDFGYEISKLAVVLGLKISSDKKQFFRALAWQDTTVRTFSTDTLPTGTYLLNSRCPNIGKDYVEEVFESVFGYSLRVDPTTYTGKCVRKSIANAKHDGAVVQCPIAQPEPGYVYQRLINNQLNDEHIIDLRTPFIGNRLPLVYLKYRPVKTRFADQNDRVEVVRTDDVYSAEEKELILKFCRAIGLDYGGVDVLRDRDSGKIYIVDVNNTPFGPPVQLPTTTRVRAVSMLAAAFQEQFVDQLPQVPSVNAAFTPTPVQAR